MGGRRLALLRALQPAQLRRSLSCPAGARRRACALRLRLRLHLPAGGAQVEEEAQPALQALAVVGGIVALAGGVVLASVLRRNRTGGE